MQAVILAGSLGTRLKPYTDEKPKSLLEIAGNPLIEWQLRWLKNYDITNVVISAGYLKEKIIGYVGNGSKFGVRVGYAVDENTLGTGGAIKNCMHLLSSDFFVVNGDILTTMNLQKLRGSTHTLSVVPLRSPFGIVNIHPNSQLVAKFDEKPVIDNIWINAGVYYFTNEIFEYLPDIGDLEDSVLPELAKTSRLKAIKFDDSYWRSIDSHKDLEEASTEARWVFAT